VAAGMSSQKVSSTAQTPPIAATRTAGTSSPSAAPSTVNCRVSSSSVASCKGSQGVFEDSQRIYQKAVARTAGTSSPKAANCRVSSSSVVSCRVGSPLCIASGASMDGCFGISQHFAQRRELPRQQLVRRLLQCCVLFLAGQVDSCAGRCQWPASRPAS